MTTRPAWRRVSCSRSWVDGERIEMTRDEWVSTRDHSWGVRYDVGTPPTDTEPGGIAMKLTPSGKAEARTAR